MSSSTKKRKQIKGIVKRVKHLAETESVKSIRDLLVIISERLKVCVADCIGG